MSIIKNDIAPISARGTINTVLVVAAIVAAGVLLYKQYKKLTKKDRSADLACKPDSNYHYKDPYYHAKDCY